MKEANDLRMLHDGYHEYRLQCQRVMLAHRQYQDALRYICSFAVWN